MASRRPAVRRSHRLLVGCEGVAGAMVQPNTPLFHLGGWRVAGRLRFRHPTIAGNLGRPRWLLTRFGWG